MTYEVFRLAFPDSEQAASVAYQRCVELNAELDAINSFVRCASTVAQMVRSVLSRPDWKFVPIDDELRYLRKWLNEESTAPIDRVALAKVLAHAALQPGQEPIGFCCYGGKKPKSACASCGAWQSCEKDAESERCIMESHQISHSDEYFDARPQIDTADRRRVFEAGFAKGYRAAKGETQ